MKGLYKGFKCTLSQFFVVKEPEIEIGLPTDVKHVAHIGADGPSTGNEPSWMKEFKSEPGFAATSIGKTPSGVPSRSSSQDYEESKKSQQSQPNPCKDKSTSEGPRPPVKRKPRKKKVKSSSSPTSSGSSRPRVAKSKTKLAEGNTEPINNIEVA